MKCLAGPEAIGAIRKIKQRLTISGSAPTKNRLSSLSKFPFVRSHIV
jgi:hypothetical protein